MGIDYLSCKNCAEGFPDVIDYVGCECGETWCSDECAKEDGYKEESCSKGIEKEDCELDVYCWQCEHNVKSSCKYCRKEDFEDSQLLKFALEKLNITREELINDYKQNVGGEI